MNSQNIKPFPKPIPLIKLLGPSFIILALGLGSGEVILWPYLSSNYGLGIAWGALLGITFQYFINMEIERYALIKGESVFVGLNKIFSWSAYWFIVSTFIGFGLPGIIAAAAKVFGFIIGVEQFQWIAIFFLIIIGLFLSLGKTVYGMMERFTKIIIFIGIPFVILLTLALSKVTDWVSLGQGLVGIGDGYLFLPPGIAIASFFAAFAYSGAGGNLNLTQSIYIKEKGYGMGLYAQKISGLFTNLKNQQQIRLEGSDFSLTKENISNFNIWWRRISIEHLVVFWLMGFVGICTLMLLSFSTTFGFEENAEGINFVIIEGLRIGEELFPFVGTIFLFVVSVMLFQTQMGVLDSTSRIMAENFALKKLDKINDQAKKINLSKIYFTFLWAQIAFGIILFLFNISEPRLLIVLGAVINALGMFVHIGLVNYMNLTRLPKKLRAGMIRRIVLLIIFLFFGIFSTITLWTTISELL